MTSRDRWVSDRVTASRQPSKAVRRRVRDAFDADALIDLCTRQDFSAYGDRFDLAPARDGHKRFYWHQDNGSDVLAVAHLDHVQLSNRCSVVDTAAGPLAVSGALDDRLGVYVILEMLPRLGITCDWLLTTDEESCASTADEFVTDKDYHWMISFDRGGTDVVMYQYETPAMCDLVEACGARVGVGSFSDIAVLDHLGCVGFNWGVGYEDYHGSRSHAWLDDTFRMVARYVKFHTANAGRRLAYEDDVYDAKWWEEDDKTLGADDWMEADCGHDVDMANPHSYVEDGSFILCKRCGPL